MRVRVLGPVEVSDGEVWSPVAAARCRAVLGTLVAHGPQSVPVESIVQDVWGDTPPRSAVTQTYGYVHRLRQMLGDRDGTALRRSDVGYLLVEQHAGVDARRFEAAVTDGLRTFEDGGFEQSADLFERALGWWRGDPFGGAPPGGSAVELTHRLTSLRTTAVEHAFQAQINLGRHRAVVEEIEAQIAESPFREPLWRQLLVALYRSGRAAEALQQYDRLRRTFTEELGTDPSPATRAIHQQILDETLPMTETSSQVSAAVAVGAEPVAPAEAARPVRQLPPEVADFCGRTGETAAAVRAVTSHDRPGSPVVLVLHGAPGAGKSSLALHVARLVQAEYPDAQFHLGLAGTSSNPRGPDELLAAMLRALGGFGHPLPTALDDCAALLRSQLAERRTLVVLDDAASAEQVLPLLPPDGRSAVIVTSRGMLADLPGARHVHVDVLTVDDAEALLARIVGGDRVAREPAEAQAIVRLCGLLPLPIRIAGAKLLSRPAWPLSRLRERLEDETRRLSELSIGGLDLRASLDVSLRSLSADAALAFALFGLLGPGDLPGWVLGALLDTDAWEPVAEELLDAALLQQVRLDDIGQPRYQMHDLLRVYARQQASDYGAGTCRQAVRRTVGSWTLLVDRLRRNRPHSLFDPVDAPRSAAPEAFPPWLPYDEENPPSHAMGTAWTAIERQSLLDAVRLACVHDLTAEAGRLALLLGPLYDQHALYEDWRTSHQTVLDRPDVDDLAAAALRRGLGQVNIYTGDFEAAAGFLRDARRTYQGHGHDLGAALALASLASVHRCRGEHDAAEAALRESLDVVAAAGDTPKEALFRGALGRILTTQGRLAEARTWLADAAALAHGIGDTHREAVVLRDLGTLELADGEPAVALRTLEQATQIFWDLSDERCAAKTLLETAPVLVALSERERALASLAEATAYFRRHGLHDDEARSEKLLAEVTEAGPVMGPRTAR
ncbi:BTAD domain-containing putative transcriptional regulator [Promicromonospora sp. NPDC060204]|uniref:AfsR/SARP family transcriptional regulator n=1 Tax=Promicromonospora sp. NPDC060204 TaxID=3347071 RepID=UPI00364E801F